MILRRILSILIVCLFLLEPVPLTSVVFAQDISKAVLPIKIVATNGACQRLRRVSTTLRQVPTEFSEFFM